MTAADDVFNVLGRVDQMRHGVVADVLGVAIPEMLKDVVEGMEGFDFIAGPLREAVGGLGGLGGVFGGDIAKSLGEFGDSVKALWEMGGGSAILEEVTKSVGALAQFNPLKDK